MADIVISMPWGRDTVRGSRKVKCRDCAVECGVAPSSFEILDRPDTVVLCAKCAAKALSADENPEFMPLRPSQLKEIWDHEAEERRN